MIKFAPRSLNFKILLLVMISVNALAFDYVQPEDDVRSAEIEHVSMHHISGSFAGNSTPTYCNVSVREMYEGPTESILISVSSNSDPNLNMAIRLDPSNVPLRPGLVYSGGGTTISYDGSVLTQVEENYDFFGVGFERTTNIHMTPYLTQIGLTSVSNTNLIVYLSDPGTQINCKP